MRRSQTRQQRICMNTGTVCISTDELFLGRVTICSKDVNNPTTGWLPNEAALMQSVLPLLAFRDESLLPISLSLQCLLSQFRSRVSRELEMGKAERSEVSQSCTKPSTPNLRSKVAQQMCGTSAKCLYSATPSRHPSGFRPDRYIRHLFAYIKPFKSCNSNVRTNYTF